jgi:hypothetical protein
MAGTDYHRGVKGFGIHKAHKAVQKIINNHTQDLTLGKLVDLTVQAVTAVTPKSQMIDDCASTLLSVTETVLCAWGT